MPDLERFRVATFNLYNLQLPGRRMHRFSKPWTEEEYAQKLAWAGAMLTELDADIVGLQELWHADALRAVLDHAGLSETYDVLATPADGSTIVCAALVRKGLLRGEPEWITTFPPGLHLESASPDDPQAPGIHVGLTGFSRPVLAFDVALREAPPLTRFYVAHLKSKLPAEIDEEAWYAAEPDLFRNHRKALGSALSTIRRTAEAAALRVLLTETMKGTVTPVIVLGDLNDGDHSNTLNILTEQPRYLVGDARGGGDIALYSGQTLQEYRDTRDVYYTHVHQDLRESLDHVLVSEQFYDNSHRRLWAFDGLAIFNDHLNDTESADHKRKGTGDHGVVTMSFRWRPTPKK
ncbi:MAG: endonuclease/exonuclease/phosphatase family protein [Propionibacteriaceae bacterium]|nr:endonuclease/exonuclease/phosphatase family protein [Propionibacteriaceae bacterium]